MSDISVVRQKDWKRGCGNLKKELPQQNNLQEDTLKISEGGNAAKKLISKYLSQHPDNLDRNLEYSRISYQTLRFILPQKMEFSKEDKSFVGRILYFLMEKGLIDPNYFPKFFIGSTRLAASEKFGIDKIETYPGETQATLSNALLAKKDFGDLDIDVVFLGTPQQIVQALSELDASSFAARAAKFGSDEVHSAVRIGNKVFQVDFVDVGKKFDSLKWNKISSFLDIGKNIKGAFQGSILRSITKQKEVPRQMNAYHVRTWAYQNPNYDISQKILQKEKDGFHISTTNFMYTPDGIKLAIHLSKQGIKSKLDFSSTPLQDFTNIKSIINFILPGADESIFISAYNIALWMKKSLPPDKIQKIWKEFQKDIEHQGLSPEEKKQGVDIIYSVLFSQMNEMSAAGAGAVAGVSSSFLKPIYKKRKRQK